MNILAVDGDTPAKHTVLIRRGGFYYEWGGSQFVLVDPNRIKTVVEGVPAA